GLAHGGNWAAYVWVNNSTTLAFPIPTAPGTYLFESEEQCNKSIAQGPSVAVPSTAATAVLTVNGSSAPVTVPGGAAVTVSIQNGPGNQWDCVSLNAAGSPASAWLSYAWVNGRNAVLSFSIPSSSSVVYEFRFWQNCNTLVVTSPTVTTTPSSASASVPPANQLPELPRAYVD